MEEKVRERTVKEQTLDEYLEKLDTYRKRRNARVEVVLRMLDEIDCYGDSSLSDVGMKKFWDAQELAREILKDDAASKHNKPPTA